MDKGTRVIVYGDRQIVVTPETVENFLNRKHIEPLE